MNRRDGEPRVHLGLHACQSPSANRYRGIARYVHDHALHLLQGHRELIAGLHLDPELPAAGQVADFCGYGLLREHASDGARTFDDPAMARIFHVMSPMELGVPLYVPLWRLLPPSFRSAGTRIVVTLYDLIPLLYEEVYLRDPAIRVSYKARLKLFSEADHVLAISNSTRDDAVRLLGLDPERITVIYGGVTDYFRQPDVPREAVRRRVMNQLPAILGPYVMYIGGIDFRKNMEGAISAYARLPQQLRRTYQMVLAAQMRDSEKEALAEYARKEGVDGRLVLPGFVPDDLLRELYQACDLFVFPSLYEGLGLPILEAMRCGAPVVVSDRSSMKELVEIDHARFNPEDPADVARVMERALTDENVRRELVEYGLERSMQFTWERVARLTADCYREVASSGAQRHVSALSYSRLVAFCTPFPPDRSGVADYSKRFLETLCDRHPLKVDIVVKGDPESHVVPAHPHMSLISVRQFRWLADHGHYDTIVYCMGNSAFHDYIYELLKERPGILWLHDVRLTGFYRWYYEQRGQDLSTLPQELLPWARRYPDYEGDLLMRDHLTQHDQGIYLAGEVASHAQKIVVISRFSKELLEIDSGGTVPVVVIPLAAIRSNGASARTSWPRLASRYGLNQRVSPVVSVGMMGPAKCPEAIIDGIVAADPAANDFVLVFVGEVESTYRQQLERRISEHKIKDRVRFTGYVEEAEFDSWLAVALCAIQMRSPGDVESSGAVMSCLAAGVPTIVSDHGPLRELPDDAVVKVAAPVEPAVLADALLQLLSDDQARERLRRGALRYAQEVSFEAVADQFWTEVLCAP